jgi:hypothetical protein
MANFGGNSLHRRQVELMLQSALRKKNSGGRNIQGGGGPIQTQPGTYGNPMMSSSSLPTAAETNAHTLKRRHSAEYGDRWNQHMKHSRPGFKREELGAKQQKDVATATKEAAEFNLKERDLQRKIAADKVKAGGGLGLNLGVGQETRRTAFTDGPALGRNPTQSPATQSVPQGPPSQQAQAPVNPAPESGGTYSYNTERDMPSRQPGYKYTLANQNPVGKEGDVYGNKYTGFQPRIMGAPHVTPPVSPAPMVTGQMPGEYDPKWRPGVQTPAQAAQAVAMDAPNYMPGPGNPVTAQKTAMPQASAPTSAAQAALEVAKDMAYRAPINAIGKENISAAADTAADMFVRKPAKQLSKYIPVWGKLGKTKASKGALKGIKGGSKWLSEFVLGKMK